MENIGEQRFGPDDDTPHDTITNNKETEISVDMNIEHEEPLSVIKEDGCSDSDINVINGNNDELTDSSVKDSEPYEKSDSKVDFALKLDEDDTLSDVEDIKTDSTADSEDSALGSLPPEQDVVSHDRDEEGQDRSDGSDSGLGSEVTEDLKIQSFDIELPCVEGLNNSQLPQENDRKEEILQCENEISATKCNDKAISDAIQPLKGSMKRKRNETEDDVEPLTKKKKDGIRFDKVTVYYFPRSQGFNCVPSQGGSTLGMEWRHSHLQNFTLTEHALEQRRLHRQMLQQIKNERHLQGDLLSSSDESETEEEASDISESELDLDSYYFLQPVPTKQRRALLRAAGVRKIEGYEKDECRDIRTSREFCGCACKGACNPETCSCSLAGIKCQVDRLHFPCGCSRDGCKNTTGRIEFNPIRVRTHFIQTLMRLGMERKNEQNQTANRQWEQIQQPSSSCMSTSTYERQKQADNILRAVSLSPRVEVESCISPVGYSNVLCNVNNSESTSHTHGLQNNVAYAYSSNNSTGHCIIGSNSLHTSDQNIRNHTDTYTSGITQEKGPPYNVLNNTTTFDAMQNHPQSYSCNLNYQGVQNMDHLKNLRSFSASNFEEFAHAHNTHMGIFHNYSQVYSSDYMQKYNNSHHQSSSMHYHQMQQNHFDMYKNGTEHKEDNYYAPILSQPYESSNKLQNVQNDDNWYSHNTLISLDNGDQSTQDATDDQKEPANDDTEKDNTETTENFGELIKKSLVESVSL